MEYNGKSIDYKSALARDRLNYSTIGGKHSSGLWSPLIIADLPRQALNLRFLECGKANLLTTAFSSSATQDTHHLSALHHLQFE